VLLLLLLVIVNIDLGVHIGPILFHEIQEAITVGGEEGREGVNGVEEEGMEEGVTPTIGTAGRIERKSRTKIIRIYTRSHSTLSSFLPGIMVGAKEGVLGIVGILGDQWCG